MVAMSYGDNLDGRDALRITVPGSLNRRKN